MKRLIAATFVLCASLAHADDEGRRWVAALSNPKLRDEAACRLILRNIGIDAPARYYEQVPDLGCLVTRVEDNTARPDGAVAIFLDSLYSDDKLRDGSFGGHFMLFDREGTAIEEFERANSLDDPGAVIRYRNDGDLAIVQQGIMGGFKGWDLGDLYVVPATTAQSSILTVMTAVRLGADGKPLGPKWEWRARDLDHDGSLEIEIGPVVDGALQSRAVYRYSPDSKRYEGPAGSLAGDFYAVPADQDSWQVACDFMRAHDPSAVQHCIRNKVPVVESRDELFEKFIAAKASRDYRLADSLVARMAAIRMVSRQMDEIASYWIFDRGRCNVDFMAIERRQDGLKYGELPDAIDFCEIAKLPVEEDDLVRARMANLIDQRAVAFRRSMGLYDQYARQSTINLRALDLLARFHLDGTRPQKGDSALIDQIRAGHADNVAVLLQRGYDPNLGVSRIWQPSDDYRADAREPFLPLPILPLQAAVDSLSTRGESALAVAKVLLDHGANPNRLKWYPHYSLAPPANPDLQSRMARLLEEQGRAMESVTAEYRGLVVEHLSGSQFVYARFVVGNGTPKRVSVPAWVSGDEHLLTGLYGAAHLEWRKEGGTQWYSPAAIEDGTWPSTTLDIEPGQSREIWMSMYVSEIAEAEDGVLYRLWIGSEPTAIHSEPFRFNASPVESRSIETARDWRGEGQANGSRQ